MPPSWGRDVFSQSKYRVLLVVPRGANEKDHPRHSLARGKTGKNGFSARALSHLFLNVFFVFFFISLAFNFLYSRKQRVRSGKVNQGSREKENSLYGYLYALCNCNCNLSLSARWRFYYFLSSRFPVDFAGQKLSPELGSLLYNHNNNNYDRTKDT